MLTNRMRYTLSKKWMHAIGWIVVLLLLYTKDSQLFTWPYIIIGDSIYLTIMASAFYFAYGPLINSYHRHKQVGRFILQCIVAITLFTLLTYLLTRIGIYNIFIEMNWPILLVPPKEGLTHKIWIDVKGIADLILVTLYLVAGLQLRLIQDWFQHDQIRKRLENEKLKAELKFLKAQVSPHFLFNTLNSLYALAYIKDEKVAPAIMQLSEIMRYMLYECSVEQVLLSKEVEYLENFIALQRLRLKDNITINFDIIGNTEGISIVPLLLIVLVENCFKHGITHSKPMEINFILTVAKNNIQFEAHNPLLPKPTSDHEKKNGGIGLHNLQERLQLAYPNQHQLYIKPENGIFITKLTLTPDA